MMRSAIVRIIGILGLAYAIVVDASCAGVLEKRVASPVIEGDSVVFRFKSPAARTVQIAGDWPGNNWARGDAESGEILVGRMHRREKDGIWELSLFLPKGRYRYRFLVDESFWMLDSGNPRIVDDGKGGKANLLIVP